MSLSAKAEYLAAIRPRYKAVSRSEKRTILDEFCRVCCYNRKYAIRLLNATGQPLSQKNLSRRGRTKQYSHPLILKVLTNFWVTTNLPCSKRLKAIILYDCPFMSNRSQTRSDTLCCVSLLSLRHVCLYHQVC